MSKATGRLSAFSEKAVKKAVLQQTATHPVSVYPTVLAVLGGLAAMLFGPSALLVWGASGAVAVGFSGWLVNYFFRRNRFAGGYLRKAHRALEAETSRRLERLRGELEELGLEQGVEQLRKFAEKLENLKKVLRGKLDERELTYGRYLGIAEQVYLSAIDNLHDAAGALRSVSAIDLDYVKGRLREMRGIEARTAEMDQEIRSLTDRQELYDGQTARAMELLSQNEVAMTHLDTTAAAIAGMRTEPGRASMDLETAMAELARLAGRAADYSTR